MMHAVPLPGGGEAIAAPDVIRWRTPRWRLVLRAVARKHRLKVADITGPRRYKDVVAARFEAAWRMRVRLGMSLPAIGRRLGGRDHTSILNAVRRHAATRGNGGPALPPLATLEEICARHGFRAEPIRSAGPGLTPEFYRRRNALVVALRTELRWSNLAVARFCALSPERASQIYCDGRRRR